VIGKVLESHISQRLGSTPINMINRYKLDFKCRLFDGPFYFCAPNPKFIRDWNKYFDGLVAIVASLNMVL
jgi:hypothetical protein